MQFELGVLEQQPIATRPFRRRKTRRVMVGNVPVGGNAPISVQTMTKTKTADVEATVAQILRCKEAGADIVRVTVNDWEAAEAIAEIVRRVDIPIVADVHFNHIFALKAIGSRERIRQVLEAAKARGIPIRIGVNSGSLEKDLLEKYGYPTPEALVESALRHVEIAQDFGFDDIIISVKSTDVRLMIEAYRMLADQVDFPLHLGVTEAGLPGTGIIKSAVGIGTLLAEGIGDTIRVSLTDEPEREVEVGKEILRSLGLAQRSVEIIACPTCGRIEVDLFRISRELEEAIRRAGIRKPVKIALLGCVVNGPGEASEADIGIAAGRGVALLYRKGEVVRRVSEEEIVPAILEELERFEPES
jgi:(E)-4-hydroxy-3-methylbut-2-enyl-diphosphate synthase